MGPTAIKGRRSHVILAARNGRLMPVMAHLLADPPALDDLQINPPARLLLAEIHGSPVVRTYLYRREQKAIKISETVALHYRGKP
jgi:hypothetical protein